MEYKKETLKKMSLEDLSKEEDRSYEYYLLVRTVIKAKQKGLL